MDKQTKADVLCDLIGHYYRYNPAGGTLHIVLDEGEVEDSSIDVCMELIEKEDDHIARAIAKLLYEFTEDERASMELVGWEPVLDNKVD